MLRMKSEKSSGLCVGSNFLDGYESMHATELTELQSTILKGQEPQPKKADCIN